MLDDKDLSRFQAGEPRFFRDLVNRLNPVLLRQLLGKVPDVDTAEDILQETWIQVYNARAQFRNDANIDTWICSIQRNAWLGWQRRQSKAHDSLDCSQIENRIDPTDEGEILRRAVAFEKRCDDIDDAILSLPTLQRRVVILRWLLRRSTAESAATLGIATGTVRASLCQAKSRLLCLLQPLRFGE